MLEAWVLKVMLLLVPVSVPWRDTFPATARAIAAEAEAHPLFRGERGAAESAALLVAVAYRESSFDPRALGDCAKGVPKSPAACASHGLFQISKANAPSAELLVPETAARHAVRLIAQSFRICRARTRAELLAWYAAGGDGCREAGVPASKNRMQLAERLLREHPLDSG